jgi:DNA-binding transcriptional ArsR family regulator
MNAKIKNIARKLEVVGDVNRLRILCVIYEKDRICVSDIAKRLKLSVAVASHHLNVLANEGILKPIRAGKNICYQTVPQDFTEDLKKLICKYK